MSSPATQPMPATPQEVQNPLAERQQSQTRLENAIFSQTRGKIEKIAQTNNLGEDLSQSEFVDAIKPHLTNEYLAPVIELIRDGGKLEENSDVLIATGELFEELQGFNGGEWTSVEALASAYRLVGYITKNIVPSITNNAGQINKNHEMYLTLVTRLKGVVKDEATFRSFIENVLNDASQGKVLMPSHEQLQRNQGSESHSPITMRELAIMLTQYLYNKSIEEDGERYENLNNDDGLNPKQRVPYELIDPEDPNGTITKYAEVRNRTRFVKIATKDNNRVTYQLVRSVPNVNGGVWDRTRRDQLLGEFTVYVDALGELGFDKAGSPHGTSMYQLAMSRGSRDDYRVQHVGQKPEVGINTIPQVAPADPIDNHPQTLPVEKANWLKKLRRRIGKKIAGN